LTQAAEAIKRALQAPLPLAHRSRQLC
jgi:hypothetical protein